MTQTKYMQKLNNGDYVIVKVNKTTVTSIVASRVLGVQKGKRTTKIHGVRKQYFIREGNKIYIKDMIPYLDEKEFLFTDKAKKEISDAFKIKRKASKKTTKRKTERKPRLTQKQKYLRDNVEIVASEDGTWEDAMAITVYDWLLNHQSERQAQSLLNDYKYCEDEFDLAVIVGTYLPKFEVVDGKDGWQAQYSDADEDYWSRLDYIGSLR